MINTYQTSMAPPPVPPRLNRSHPVLIPAQMTTPGHNKPLVRFLVIVVVLHLLLSVGGFIFLYNNDQERHPPAAGKAAALSSEKQSTYYKALARMAVDRSTSKISTGGYLQWDIKHSVLSNINYYQDSWLTVLQSGDYYVYSRVTFSKGDSVKPQVSRVKLRKSNGEVGGILMEAYCNLGARTGIPHMCTATQGEVVTLEEGNQLSVWIENLSLVDYGDRVTVFGMYKL
ncbi:CD40 ligand [Solea solea]|uniref:CD40 ligand n=1 Tax=Solea solea TaxID=90069 RepID=UPI00272CBB24|nr:CD40 ligand [Solea solea]